jgi:two-component system response regulator DevR
MSLPPSTRPVRVLIADDHAVVRIGLRTILADDPGIEIVGEAGRAGECLELVERLEPDVVVLDQRFPDGSGHEVCRSLKARNSPPAVLMLTSFGDDQTLLACLSAGADGYLLKDLHHADLARAILQVAAGGFVLAPDLARRTLLAGQPAGERPLKTTDDPAQHLTPQELRVMDLLVAGSPNKEIAARLQLSDGTIRNYLSAIYPKLGVANRTEAVALWLQRPGRSPIPTPGPAEILPHPPPPRPTH